MNKMLKVTHLNPCFLWSCRRQNKIIMHIIYIKGRQWHILHIIRTMRRLIV